MKVLVISPHPDDEVLGVGATMHRLVSQGEHVTVAIVTRGWEPLFPESQVQQVRAEAAQAAKTLGVTDLRFLDLPVTRLHALPKHELNATLDKLVRDVEPQWVFLPFPGDRHDDHRQIFDAALVALRPNANRPTPSRVLCYETASETHWAAPNIEPGFDPNVYIDVTDHLEAKLDAMKCYVSQVRPAPDARSLEALKALARWRGSVVNLHAAEAFVLVREIL